MVRVGLLVVLVVGCRDEGSSAPAPGSSAAGSSAPGSSAPGSSAAPTGSGSGLAEAEAPILGPELPEAAPAIPPGNMRRGQLTDVQTISGCFYFSGPDGRDTKLGSDIAIGGIL